MKPRPLHALRHGTEERGDLISATGAMRGDPSRSGRLVLRRRAIVTNRIARTAEHVDMRRKRYWYSIVTPLFLLRVTDISNH